MTLQAGSADSHIFWVNWGHSNLLAFACGCIFLGFPISLQILMDRVVMGHQVNTLGVIALAMLILVGTEYWLGQRKSRRLRLLTTALQHRHSRGHTKESSSLLRAPASNLHWAGDTAFALLALWVMWWIDPEISGVLLSVSTLLGLGLWFYGKKPSESLEHIQALSSIALKVLLMSVLLMGVLKMMQGALSPGQWIALSVLSQRFCLPVLNAGTGLSLLGQVVSVFEGEAPKQKVRFPLHHRLVIDKQRYEVVVNEGEQHEFQVSLPDHGHKLASVLANKWSKQLALYIIRAGTTESSGAIQSSGLFREVKPDSSQVSCSGVKSLWQQIYTIPDEADLIVFDRTQTFLSHTERAALQKLLRKRGVTSIWIETSSVNALNVRDPADKHSMFPELAAA